MEYRFIRPPPHPRCYDSAAVQRVLRNGLKRNNFLRQWKLNRNTLPRYLRERKEPSRDREGTRQPLPDGRGSVDQPCSFHHSRQSEDATIRRRQQRKFGLVRKEKFQSEQDRHRRAGRIAAGELGQQRQRAAKVRGLFDR